MRKILKYSFASAALTALYIIIVALFFNFAKVLFPASNTILIPILMLLLFVFSAALTGSLVLGRPVMWYLDGKKKEAVSLLVWTIAFLFVLVVVAMITLILYGL